MEEILGIVTSTFLRFNFWSLLEILTVAAIIQGLIILFRRTTASSLFYGLVLLTIFVVVINSMPQLVMLNWLLRNVLPFLAFAMVILFAPELRRALERIGRLRGMVDVFNPLQSPVSLVHTIEEIGSVCRSLASRHYGALLVLERRTGLQEYAETGKTIDGLVSAELLLNIFTPGTPLHDGAVIIRNERVVAAGCTLPLSRQSDPTDVGMRHRAALGVTEQTDAICIVVSEETGLISLANRGYLVKDMDDNKLRKALSILLRPQPMEGPGFWPWRRPTASGRQAVEGSKAGARG